MASYATVGLLLYYVRWRVVAPGTSGGAGTPVRPAAGLGRYDRWLCLLRPPQT